MKNKARFCYNILQIKAKRGEKYADPRKCKKI